MEETLKITECMKIIRVSRPTILKLIRDGELKAFKVGTTYRVRKLDLDEFIQSGINEPKAAAK